MLIAGIPAKIAVPWADGAVAPYVRPIPVPSQSGIQGGAASYTDGFPPDTFLPVGAGGTPPWGADFNGILQAVTKWLRWIQAGGPIAYDPSFQATVGGYPVGALVASTATFGLYFVSTVDGNTTNPDASGAGWFPVPLCFGGVLTVGSWTWRPTQEDLVGWTKANATTIGNAGSGATQLAHQIAFKQFEWLWTNFSNSQCPVLPGGRGANPTADFAALKTIMVLDMRGMAPIGMDTMAGAPTTRLAGVPVISGPSTQAGSVLGEILHTLVTTELAAHNHGLVDPGHNHGIADSGHFHQIASNAGPNVGTTFSIAGGVGVGPATATTDTRATGISVNGNGTGITINNTGSNIPHNNVALAMCGTHYFKL